MSSLTKMLSVLELFSREHTAMTADEIGEALGLARTTCYRYLKELSDAGLLLSNAGVFRLGPRIIQLDYRIRESDPLLNASRDVIADLVRRTGGTALLAAIYDDKIINVHQEGPQHLSYGRGKVLPVFLSASSKVILAQLRPPRLKRIWKAHQGEREQAALGAVWAAFAEQMRLIRKRGYWVSRGELDATLDGVAAPILFADGAVAGSLTLVFRDDQFRLYDEAALGAAVIDAAAEIGALLART
jgi:DNA-binding IclR family transcriptional regulator